MKNLTKEIVDDINDLVDDINDRKSLKDYAEMVEGKKCKWCGKVFIVDESDIDYYDHDGGWSVKGFDKKQWLSVYCEKCEYDWSLWKLGVERE